MQRNTVIHMNNDGGCWTVFCSAIHRLAPCDDVKLSVEETEPVQLCQVADTDANAEIFCETSRRMQDFDTDSGCWTAFCSAICRLALRIRNLFMRRGDDLKLSQEETSLSSVRPFLSNYNTLKLLDTDLTETANTWVSSSEPTVTQ